MRLREPAEGLIGGVRGGGGCFVCGDDPVSVDDPAIDRDWLLRAFDKWVISLEAAHDAPVSHEVKVRNGPRI